MFVTLLKFAENRSAAGEFMAGHNEWIAKGFADGVFLSVGSLDLGGGAVIAHGESREAHDARIAADPFVEHGVVSAETYEIDPKRTVPALAFTKVA
ncbi:hypothetical protein H7H48_10425 [Nitratireductor sp. B36]|uniref:YCII-related domain-containing protein n=1 Tax=Nitratireductor aquibiodomus RA22 TaxID=1189611 RepID=I5C7G8_9HYPH|nr:MULTISPECIES: hypothetical protein [Nitratireductor]EIM77770.1 hypothetical protein A33O_01692 [Nitratireductor aquibiodomus RA22]MCC5779469.1 hypothetical protein [Nitratireductor sp. B36]